LYIIDILERAGVPKGVVNFVLPQKTGAMISKMLHDPRVRNLSFTGSTEVGRILLKEAADTIVRTSMELGGNAPFVILDDANVDEAVKGRCLPKCETVAQLAPRRIAFMLLEKLPMNSSPNSALRWAD